MRVNDQGTPAEPLSFAISNLQEAGTLRRKMRCALTCLRLAALRHHCAALGGQRGEEILTLFTRLFEEFADDIRLGEDAAGFSNRGRATGCKAPLAR